MTDHTVPAAPGGSAPHTIPVPADFLALLEATATGLIAGRANELEAGVGDGRAPRHVCNMLIDNLVQAIDARAEIVAAASLPEPELSTDTLRLIGPEAVHDERERLAREWELGGDDLKALADYTLRLNDLDAFLTLARVS
jgi:hypothetical protein